MNKLIIFNCIHFQYSKIYKIIFTTIINQDPYEWLDNNIEYIYNKFDLTIVLDWEITSIEDTDQFIMEDIRVENILEGAVIFYDNLEYQLLKEKAKGYDLIKEKERLLMAKPELSFSEREKRDYESCWIDLLGKKYTVAFAEHEAFVREWLRENDKETYEKTEFSSCLYTILEDRGWIKIVGWADPPRFVIPSMITPSQKNALREYCIKNKVLYKYFPEILKS